MARGNFIWLVSVPYGMAGSCSTRAPRSWARRAGPFSDHLDLKRVGAVRKMKVMRLGRPQRQDGDLKRPLGLDLTVVQLSQSPWLHLELAQVGCISRERVLACQQPNCSAAAVAAQARSIASAGVVRYDRCALDRAGPHLHRLQFIQGTAV